MNLLITGGTGFFGKSILRYLAFSNQKPSCSDVSITLLSRHPEKFICEYGYLLERLNATVQYGDILQRESLPWEKNFSHVLHAAADSSLGPSLDSMSRYDQIVSGTRNILDLALNTKAKRFLLTSSGAVYGAQPQDLIAIPEGYLGMPDPLDAINAYGVAKRTAEHLCALYYKKFGLNFSIARCFAFVGQDLPLDIHFAIGNFISDALKNSSIEVKGDGSPLRTYLNQNDLAEWLIKILLDGRPGEAYNVGSDEKISIRDLAYLVRDIIAPHKKVSIIGTPSLEIRNRYVPDISKVRAEFNLQVKISLRDSIAQVQETLSIGKKL